MAEVRLAGADEVGALAQALARAFHDDPVMLFLVPERNRHDRIVKFFTTTAVRDMAHGEVWTTDGLGGGALWNGPDQWRLGVGELLRMTPTVFGAFGSRVPRALRTLGIIEKAHPKAPHWYLGILGTDPPQQGKGIGGALMQPVLERCDREGLPAYLESSKESNVPFYRRHGFEVTEELQLPDGPKMWGMWREPRP
jgi:GNAT superfamily N-acetyltransferase